MYRSRLIKKMIPAALLCVSLSAGSALCAHAYDADKLKSAGMLREDLSTWTQRDDSFPENAMISVNGRSCLDSMGCSYYATFFMMCKAGAFDPLEYTAWEFAKDCYDKGLSRSQTGYFEPRSADEMTNGRVRFVEDGNFGDYYSGQSGIAACGNTQDVIDLLRDLTKKKGYFCVACCVGGVTNSRGEEYYSQGHYIFIDDVLRNDLIIGDSAFDGRKWSDNWGRHNAQIVKIYCYEAFDAQGRKIRPSDCESMYRIFTPQDETESEALTETETEALTEAETEAPAETESEALTEAETEAETESEALTEAETEALTEAETEALTEAETEAETESEALTEAETETEKRPGNVTPPKTGWILFLDRLQRFCESGGADLNG